MVFGRGQCIISGWRSFVEHCTQPNPTHKVVNVSVGLKFIAGCGLHDEDQTSAEQKELSFGKWRRGVIMPIDQSEEEGGYVGGSG